MIYFQQCFRSWVSCSHRYITRLIEASFSLCPATRFHFLNPIMLHPVTYFLSVAQEHSDNQRHLNARNKSRSKKPLRRSLRVGKARKIN
jgi:hypothetical protein